MGKRYDRNAHWLGGIHYSWITDNLAVGGFRGSEFVDGKRVYFTDEQMLATAAEAFDIVVLCCDYHQPSSKGIENATVVHMGFREQLRGPIRPEVIQLIEEKVPLLDELLTGDKKMLCACAMGAARSPFVAASLLKHRGLSGEEAVELIQTRRVFINFLYMDYLIHGHEPDYETVWLPTIEERRNEYWKSRKDG